MPENLENSAVATVMEKISFHYNPKEGQCQRVFKLSHNCTHFSWGQGNAPNPSSQTSMQEPPYVQPGFRKVRETKDQIANIHWIIKKQRNSRETSTSASLTTLNL